MKREFTFYCINKIVDLFLFVFVIFYIQLYKRLKFVNWIFSLVFSFSNEKLKLRLFKFVEQ